MQEPQKLQAERKLERRAWVGCVLTFVVAGVTIALITALPMKLFESQPDQPGGSPIAATLIWLALFLVIGVAGIYAMLRFARWTLAPEQRRYDRGTAVFKRTLPELALGDDAQPTRVKSERTLASILAQTIPFVVCAIILIPIVNGIVPRLLPDAPGIVNWLLIFWILLLLERPLRAMSDRLNPTRGKSTPTTAAASSSPGVNILGVVLYIAVGLLPVLSVIPLVGQLPLPPSLLAVAELGACTLAFMLFSLLYMIVPMLWIMDGAKRADYAGAIARARWVERLSLLRGFYLNMHGVVLLWAGRYEEARQIFEESIGAQRQEARGTGNAALENIGCALAWQGNYDEAIKMFEGSIEMSPSQAMVYSDLAEAYLYQGIELPRALELTDRAWSNYQASFEMRALSAYEGGQILATRAWALALLGRHADADEMLRRAFAIADRKFKPVLAGIYLRAGYVSAARGDRAKAVEYFGEGQRIDPHGHYARLCARAIAAQG